MYGWDTPSRKHQRPSLYYIASFIATTGHLRQFFSPKRTRKELRASLISLGTNALLVLMNCAAVSTLDVLGRLAAAPELKRRQQSLRYHSHFNCCRSASVHHSVSDINSQAWNPEEDERPNSPTSGREMKKQKLFGEDSTSSKILRSNSQVSKLRRELNSCTPNSLYETNRGKYNNRLFGCLAVSPAGRSLNDFRSI